HGTLVRAEDSFDVFVRDRLEAVAGVKQAGGRLPAGHPDGRGPAGPFMEIEQAVWLSKGRGARAHYLRALVREMKASGFVADALRRSNQADATVAPPASK